MKKVIFGTALLIPIVMTFGAAPRAEEAPPPLGENTYVWPVDIDYQRDYPALNADGTINAVIEIPAGTNDKWMVYKEDGKLKWEFQDGKPRVVRYLGYPVNYGMIPRTVNSKEAGGDGDPLDVLVLGPALPRGSVVRAKVIGVLKLVDKGEQDDKIVAVDETGPVAEAATIAELKEKFPGAAEIVDTWLTNYKGPGKIKSLGYGTNDEALKTLGLAREAYAKEAGAAAAAETDAEPPAAPDYLKLRADVEKDRTRLFENWQDIGRAMKVLEGADSRSLKEAAGTCEVAVGFADSLILMMDLAGDRFFTDPLVRREMSDWAGRASATVGTHREILDGIRSLEGLGDGSKYLIGNLCEILQEFETRLASLKSAPI